MTPELISFKLCPFVQRSIIVLLEKQAAFNITYIDLADPPEWFSDISPMGKVPVLKVGDAVLFESAVIMEYLDEVNPPSLHPADPLQKARNRAWIEFASGLFFAQYRMTQAEDEAGFQKERSTLRQELERVEPQVAGPYFNGEDYRLVDAAFAPFFLRADWLERWYPTGLFEGLPKVAAWKEALLARDSTQRSVVEGFADLFASRIAAGGGAFAAQAYAG